MLYCVNCGASAEDNELLCAACGGQLVPRVSLEKPPDMPAGITLDENGALTWEAECRAIAYKPIFTLTKGLIGTLYILIMMFAVGYGSENGLNELIKAVLIVTGIFGAIYLFAAGGLLLKRDGRFCATFTLTGEEVGYHENVHPPTSRVKDILLTIWLIITLIFAIFIMFAPAKNRAHVNGGSDAMNTQRRQLSKIKSIKITPDNKMIKLKCGGGRLWLVVTPEQCGFIENEIKKRRKAGRQEVQC